jgi:hypothetical protein
MRFEPTGAVTWTRKCLSFAVLKIDVEAEKNAASLRESNILRTCRFWRLVWLSDIFGRRKVGLPSSANFATATNMLALASAASTPHTIGSA